MFLSRILLCSFLCVSAAPVLAQTPAPTPGAAIPVPNTPLSLITNSTQWRLEQISADHVHLTGQVEIETGSGMKFFADEIDIFSAPTLRLVATGNVVFTNPEGRIAAERVEFNVAEGTGTFHQASGIMSLGPTVDRAQFGNQDPDVYFYGDTIEKLNTRSYKLTRGGFTTCVQPTPRWEVTSDSVVINLNDYAIARGLLLRVKGVPLMYLPILYYPIKGDERATGFLLPTYGSSTLRGQALSNAFFWAIGRSQDATFFHDWFTQTGQGTGAEYRYVSGQASYGNFRFYRLSQRQAEFRQSGRVAILPGQSSHQFSGTGNQAIGTPMRAHARVDYSSNLITQQLYQQSLYQASNATRTVEAGLTGTWGGVTTSALVQRIETFTGADTSQLYGSNPRITAALAPRRLFGLPIYGSVANDFGRLPYRQVTNGRIASDRSLTRLDVLPTLRAALSRLSFLTFNTSASYRSTYYTRSADLSGRVTEEPLLRRYLALRSDVVGPVLAKIWDTPGSGFSERMKHLIEPTFALEYVPAIGNSARVLTLTDSTDVILGGSTRLTYGLNNRLLYRRRTLDSSAGSTIQFLTVGLQQTYYMTPRASLNDNQYVSTGFRSRAVDLSDIALNIKVTPSAALDSTARVEYDVHGEGLHVITMGTTAQLGRSSTTINYSRYRKQSPAKPESSLSWSSALNLLQGRARGAYSLTWDIGRAGILNQSVGMSYLAQCCGIQAEFQKFKYPQSRSDFPIPSDRRFNVSFVLAGLGTFSNFFGAFGGLVGAGS
ncbi:MAG: LPS-assembly protein LptD [Acidobacteria bacterium]|nr:LPS-assembly protein LptD [Acidobacteriota bacterium]